MPSQLRTDTVRHPCYQDFIDLASRALKDSGVTETDASKIALALVDKYFEVYVNIACNDIERAIRGSLKQGTRILSHFDFKLR
jgi:hypothetical protein